MVDLTQEDNRPAAHRLYTEYVESGARGETATELWGRIPTTMGEAYKLLRGIREAYGSAPDEIEELKKATRLEPMDANSHFNLAVSHRKRGDIEEAIREYEIVLAIAPDFEEANHNMRLLYNESTSREKEAERT